MKMNKWIASAFSILAILCAACLFFSDRLIVLYIARIYHLDATYGSVNNKHFGEYSVVDLKLIDRRYGVGISAEEALFKIRSIRNYFRDIAFDLKGVRFVTDENSSQAKVSNDLMDVLTAPFKGKWSYKRVSGAVRSISRGIRVESLQAESDEIMFHFNGDLFDNNTIDAGIKISFDSKMADKMFGGMAGSALEEGQPGWRDISAELKGDFKAPSIQVTGKMFRLNIRAVAATAAHRE